MSTHYHYIITGAGCAGLSLLMRMMKEPFFDAKKILVIDQSKKTSNDRTWCFWEKESDIFEPIVQKSWKQVNFFSKTFSAILPIAPYQYKMIQGLDLYTYVLKEAANHVNIEWKFEKVKAIASNNGRGSVELESGTYTSDYLFNSIDFKEYSSPSLHKKKPYLLLQHFKGWVIETPEPSFDASVATIMDFRVPQNNGTTFMYVMPISPNKALVEYTLFTEKKLPIAEYEMALRDYIDRYLKVSDYSIVHEEFGVIPMTNQLFPLQDGRIIFMGIAGGQAKGSSGYAFQFIQKRTRFIVHQLIKNNSISMHQSWTDKKFNLYDSVLLNVLSLHKIGGDAIFSKIFKHNPTPLVLRFLDNESSIWDDFQIMRSVPTNIFLPAALQEIRS